MYNFNFTKLMKMTAIAILTVIAVMILLIVGYVIYVAAQYYRIEDNKQLEIIGNRTQTVAVGETYSVMSYNLGFGAYSPEYSFFMDTGVMNDGTEVVGKYAKGINKADVQKNVDGQLSVAQAINADFYFFQEVDVKADRSYDIDMFAAARAAFPDRSAIYAENFHTAALYYPFNDPIGKTNAGILTMSRYQVDSAVRRSFPVTTAFIDKLFDLDRCFSVQYLPVENSDNRLVLINLHMSAYDDGGSIRARQLEMLNSVLAEEYAKGNYVVAGGDFNHCLIADFFNDDETALAYFKSDQRTPDWVKNSVLHQAELAAGFKLCASPSIATCRGADIPYTPDVNYSTVIDGFIISDNIDIISEGTIDTRYAYSDHNPVNMKFKLK